MGSVGLVQWALERSVGPRLNLFPVRDRVQLVPVPSERPRLRRSDHTPSSWDPSWRDLGVRGVLKTTAKTAHRSSRQCRISPRSGQSKTVINVCYSPLRPAPPPSPLTHRYQAQSGRTDTLPKAHRVIQRASGNPMTRIRPIVPSMMNSPAEMASI